MTTRISSSVVTSKIHSVPPNAVEPSVSWRSASRPIEAGVKDPAIAMAGPHPGIRRSPPRGEEKPLEKKNGSSIRADRVPPFPPPSKEREGENNPNPHRAANVARKTGRGGKG